MPKTIFGGDHQRLVEVLTEARKRADLTQSELAMRIGRDQTFISLIERGQRRVDVIEFISLAKALGDDPATLFEHVIRKLSNGDEV